MSHPNPALAYFLERIDKEPDASAPPFTQWLRGVIREVGDGTIAMEFTVRREMLNPAGLLHGGVQNAMIDDVMGMTVASLGSETIFVSINLSVDHLGMAREGDRVTARSRIVRRGKTLVNIECDLTDAEGRLISRGTANYFKTNLPAFRPNAG